MESSKMSAALQAFLRLAREHRQYRRELTQEMAAVEAKEASQVPLCLPERVRPLLKEADGVLEDNLKYQKRRLAKHGPVIFQIDDEDERFYETHGFYPAEEEWDRVDDEEEEGNSDKDERDGHDELRGEEERGRRTPESSTDSTDAHRLRGRGEEGKRGSWRCRPRGRRFFATCRRVGRRQEEHELGMVCRRVC